MLCPYHKPGDRPIALLRICCDGRHYANYCLLPYILENEMGGKQKLFFLFFIFLFSQTVFATQKIPRVIVAPKHHSKLLTYTIKKIITRKQIKMSGAQKLSQLLQAVSGIQLKDFFGDGSRVTVGMRGFGDNAFGNTLILLNGSPLVNPTIAPSEFNEIPVSEIKQIEIMPGSSGVLYGDQAVGGVINIVTKAPKKHQRHAAISYGSYNTQKYQVAFSDVFKNGFGYRVNAQHYRSNHYRNHNKQQINNLGALITKKFTTGSFYLQYKNIDNHLQLPGYEQPGDRRAAKNNTDFNNQNNNILLAGLEKNINPNWRFKFDSLLRGMRGKGSYSLSPFKERQDDVALRPKVVGAVNLFNTTFMPVIGADYLNGKYKYDGTGYYYAAKQEEYAGYGQITAPLKSNLDLVFGARSAKSLSHKNALSQSGSGKNHATITNAGLLFYPNKNSQIFVKRAGSYRFPKADELALSQNNQQLKTQTGISYEGGYRWHNQVLQLFFDAYQLNLRNEILFVPNVNSPFLGRNENLAPTKRRGVMANFNYALHANWHILFNYNFVDAKFDSGVDAGKTVPFVARNTARVASDYTLHKNWELFAEGVYIGSCYLASDVQNLAGKLNGYMVYNANISYQHKPFTISFRCNNIFNKYYYSYAMTQYTGGGAHTSYFYPAPGRNFLLTVGVDIV